jgi:hypothetical protein
MHFFSEMRDLVNVWIARRTHLYVLLMKLW